MPKGAKGKPNPRLDAFFTAAPAGLAILDHELRYVQLNETLAAMNGLSVQAHLGRRVREVLPALAPVVEPILQQILGRRVLPSNIEIQFEAADGPGRVEADPIALEQILMNLVTNARDAMPEGGTLHVEVGPVRLDEEDRPLHAWIEPGSFGCLTVSDTGVGMDERTLARVFEPFFTTKPRGVGTGLGLPMVYGLVKQHKGFVHFYSEPGQGTTVKVYLPLALDQARAARAPTRDERLPGGIESILLIEDEARLRNVAERLLRKVGYRVLAAPDGEQGLALYRAHRTELDLIVTDLMMPRLGGMRLYEMLRLEGEPIKVLFTSGYPEQLFRERASHDPAVAFVTKPWTASELLRQIRALLDRPMPRTE